jgi:hypothetical protein
MSGIVSNNYVASYGENVALDMSVAISGGLICTPQKDYRRSRFTWQPLIAAYMKKYFNNQKWGQRLCHQLGQDDYRDLVRANTVVVSASFLLVGSYTGIMVSFIHFSLLVGRR